MYYMHTYENQKNVNDALSKYMQNYVRAPPTNQTDCMYHFYFSWNLLVDTSPPTLEQIPVIDLPLFFLPPPPPVTLHYTN